MSVLNSINIDSFADRIFSPDPLACFLHESVYGGQGGSSDDETLRKLMLAVLQDGIACYERYFFKPSRRNEALSSEAEEWINSNDNGIFSFNNVCDTLGLVPNMVRKGLEKWKAKQLGVPPEERSRLISSKGKGAGKKGKAA